MARQAEREGQRGMAAVCGDRQRRAVGMALELERQVVEVVILVGLLLPPRLVEVLAKIPLLVQQPYGDDRHTQIAGGFELIASHIAKSSRIDRKRFAQHEFHAEISDRGQWRLRMILLKPRG